MKLDALRLSVAIVDEGSLSAAGRRLRLPRSVVSDRLQELERVAGARLLHRSSRVTRLTDAGTLFYDVAARTVSDLDEVLAALSERRGELSGSIRVAAPVTFGIGHLCQHLGTFLAEHPRVMLDLDLDDRFVDLSLERFDLAVRIGELSDSALIARRLATSWRIVIASPAYAKRNGLPTTATELVNHPSVSYTNISPRDEWRFRRPDGSEIVVRPRSRCLIPGFDGALFTAEWRDALWVRFSMGAPRRQRRSVERYSIVKRA